MAKSQDRQLAQCVELSSYTDREGKTRETAKLRLDNNNAKEFEVAITKYFKPIKDRYYTPIIDVISVAKYSEAKKKAYNKNQAVIQWEEV
jgi:hypothetical protein